MKRLISSLAFLAAVVVFVPRAQAQLTLTTGMTVGPQQVTILADRVTGHTQTGQYGSATVRSTSGVYYTILFPEPSSLFASQPSAKLTPVCSELMLRTLKEAHVRPAGAYSIAIRKVQVFDLGTKRFYIAWRDTSIEQRLSQVPNRDWALVSAFIEDNPSSNYYGTLLIARRPGDNRNCHLLRKNATIENTYLQALLPDWSGAGVLNVVDKMLFNDGVQVNNYFQFTANSDRIIHYASRW